MQNRLGLSITCTSTDAAQAYREAEARTQAALGGAAALLDHALSIDPDFALANVARYELALDAQDENADAWRARALEAQDRVSPWERGHIRAVLAACAGDDDAVALAREQLATTPLDLSVLAKLSGHLFFHGGAGKRAALLSELENVAPHYGDDWAFLARHGFAASEAGDRDRGRELLDRSLSENSDSLYTIHALAHALHDANELEESATLLTDWLGGHPAEGWLLGHVQWHLALNEWGRGETSAAVERYEAFSAPATSTCGPMLQLADAGGLLFRLYLDGQGPESLPDAGVRELVTTLAPALHLPFVALHATAALLAIGDQARLEECIATVRDRVDDDRRGSIAKRVVDAVSAFSRERYAEAGAILDELDDGDREAVGGSNVERELLSLLHAGASSRAASRA